MLTDAELKRYSRQLTLPELGLDGQARLRKASVLVVGAGGLGSPVSLYLAAAGVGRIGIVDDDRVELHNLHRQIAHASADIGREKAQSAAESLIALNPEVTVTVHAVRLDAGNAGELIGPYDLVVDGSDNYATRYAVNDACAQLGKPWVFGSVEKYSGQVSVFGAPQGPCYRCVFPKPPAPGQTASCEEIGVLGAVPGVVGSMQAVEALKWIAGIGEPLVGKLVQFDLRYAQWHTVLVEKRQDCEACSSSSTRATTPADARDVQPVELAELLKRSDAPAVIDVREQWEWSVARIDAARLVPLGELQAAARTLDRVRPMVVLCHTGVRSGMAAEWLRTQGFNARNLVGGIDRWSRDVDPSVPRY